MIPSATIHEGDSMAVLRTLPSESVHCCVTDPPYELGFMGRGWDKSGIANSVELWAEVLRVLKPGGHLLAFGGTRTYHRMVCAIEDAGFEIRDQMMWVYGSGFPKSLDVSKAIDKARGAEREVIAQGVPVKGMIPGADQNATGSWIKDNGRTFTPQITAPATDEARQWQGWGTAIKPAWEPITVARKPLAGTVAANVLAHGTGALNIDGCRVELAEGDSLQDGLSGNYQRLDTADREGKWGFKRVDRPAGLGRWPANVVHDGSEEVLALFPAEAGAAAPVRGTEPTADGFSGSVYGSAKDRKNSEHTFRGDSGSAARFFPRFEFTDADLADWERFKYCAKASPSDRGEGNTHPTVKPNALMRWLVRLVCPPGGTIIDPFLGSGSTARAALEEGVSCIGIELDPKHVEIARRRCSNITPGLALTTF